MCKRVIVHLIEESEEFSWHEQLKLWFIENNFIFSNQEWQGNMENILNFYAIFAFSYCSASSPCAGATRNRNSGEETGGEKAKKENSAVRRSLKGKGRKEMSASFCVNAILKGMKLKENVRSCKRWILQAPHLHTQIRFLGSDGNKMQYYIVWRSHSLKTFRGR